MSVEPGARQKSLLRAALACATLLVVDTACFFAATASSSTIGSVPDASLFLLQGLGIAAWLALLVVVLDLVVRPVARALFGRVGQPRLAVVVAAAWITAVSPVLVGTGTGGGLELAPWPITLLSLLPGPLLGVGLYAMGAQRRDALRLMVASFLSVAMGLWVLAHYAGLILNGRFGLADATSRTRSLTLWLTLVALVVMFGLHARRQFLLRTDRRATWSALAVLAGLISLHAINAWVMVDLHHDLHVCLMVGEFLAAWHLSEVVVHRLPARFVPSGRALAVGIGLAAAAGAVVIAATGPASAVRYAGAVHTVFQRTGLEVVYDGVFRAHELPGELLDTVDNRLRKRRGWDFPVESGPLPSTFAALNSASPQPPPGLDGAVLFLLDMQKPEDFGLYGRQPSITPAIDKCFHGASVFRRSYAASNHTAATFPTLYTSTHGASRHQDLSTMRTRPPWFAHNRGANLGSAFTEAGFQTTVLANQWYVTELFNPAHKAPIFGGFTAVHTDSNGEGSTTQQLADAYSELGGIIPEDGRFLTVIHIFAHGTDDIDEIDAFVGSVCEELAREGRTENTALLLTADHGVQHREHGRLYYGLTLFDEEVRVPLLIKVPGVEAQHVEEPVSSIDVLPTLLDVFRIPAGFSMEGRSLWPRLAGRPFLADRPVFLESRRTFHSTAVIVGRHKLIRWSATGTEALFDLDADPLERQNVATAPAHRAAYEALSQHLDQFAEERDEESWPSLWIPQP